MSIEEASMAVEQTGSTDTEAPSSEQSTGIDWYAIWDLIGREPHEKITMSQLPSLVTIETNAADEESAAERIQRARELEELDYTGSGYVLETGDPTDDTDSVEDGEEGPTSKNKSTAKSTQEDRTHETSSRSQSDRDAEIEKLQGSIAGVHERLNKIQAENEIIMEAFVNLAGEDKAVKDEIPQLMEGRSNQISRMSRTISKVSEQLEDVGQAQPNQRTPTQNRITAIHKGLVKENVKSNRARWRDVDIMRFLDGQGVDLARSTCSNLLNDAADAHEAFEKKKNNDGRKVLAVDLDKIDQASILRPKNEAAGEGA